MAKRLSELAAELEADLIGARSYIEILRDRLALAAEKEKRLEGELFELEMEEGELERRIFDLENDL